MAEENKKELSHFYPVTCPKCAGRGCDFCGSFGLAYWYTDLDPNRPTEYALYWGKIIDWQHIAQRQLEKIFNKFVDIALMVFGIAGLLLGAWAWGMVFWETKALTFSLYPPAVHFLGWPSWGGDWRVLLFWLSLLADLYLYYRSVRKTEKEQTVIRKIFTKKSTGAEDDNQPLVPNWVELDHSHGKKIDISYSYSAEAIKSLEQAWRIAKNWHHQEVLPIHLLAGSFSSKEIGIIFGRLGANWEKLTQGTKLALAKVPRGEGDPVLALELKNVLFHAYEQAYLGRQSKVTLAEMLIAVDQEKNLASELLYDLKIESSEIKNVAVWLQINERLREQWSRHHRLGGRRPAGEVNKAYTAVMTPFLDAFSTDLSRQAAYGVFPANIGREKELEEIFRVIQGSGESVVLVGLPGVGKTAVIEEIAQRMIADEVPGLLQDKRLVSISIPKLTAGVSPADVNERLLHIFNEVERAGNVILVVENVHQLIGITAGGDESLDLSGVLANYLSKTSSIAITTTTPQDYSLLETSSVLGTHLHKINIAEPEGDQAIQILESRVASIEYKNKIYFSYEAIAKAVELSSRYVHERYLPAKAIDVLKEAAVYVAQSKGQNSIVTGEDIATIVSQKTNIPLTKINEKETEKLVNLEEEIHKRMIGQEEPVKEVAAALRRARAGMRDNKRPIANFLFLGPTGVGKTELAKTIAEVYFGDEKNMIRLDMSEYQTKDSLYRLIGAPDGERSGGYLTEAVRHNPFSLVLFDEVEKAHPDILNLFLQVMDDGRLTDNAGRTIDFTSSIIIMTSNAGTKYIQEQVKAGTPLEQVKKELMENRLGEFFRPEFLNRFDSINVFRPLGMAEVTQIAELMVKGVAKNLLREGVALVVSPEALAEWATLGFDPEFGARPLRRVIQEKLDNVLANLKIKSQFDRGEKIVFGPGGQVEVGKQ